MLFIITYLSLNSDLRAVEFFIRDKYEKKKYYSKNVTNGSSVCTDTDVIFLIWSRFHCLSLVFVSDPVVQFEFLFFFPAKRC